MPMAAEEPRGPIDMPCRQTGSLVVNSRPHLAHTLQKSVALRILRRSRFSRSSAVTPARSLILAAMAAVEGDCTSNEGLSLALASLDGRLARVLCGGASQCTSYEMPDRRVGTRRRDFPQNSLR
jgi:hypothetical protein